MKHQDKAVIQRNAVKALAAYLRARLYGPEMLRTEWRDATAVTTVGE